MNLRNAYSKASGLVLRKNDAIRCEFQQLQWDYSFASLASNPPFGPLYKIERHVCPKKFVPYGKEWLRIIVLQPLQLMMNVMVSCVILEKDMEDVARQPQSTVIINSFHNSEAEEYSCCSCSHP